MAYAGRGETPVEVLIARVLVRGLVDAVFHYVRETHAPPGGSTRQAQLEALTRSIPAT